MNASSNEQRELLIACRTLRTEIEHVVSQHDVKRPIIWMESKLHDEPQKLSAALQETLDGIHDVDLVIFGYGNCGNAVQGLQTGDFELVIPRLDDCISLVFGSQKRREAYGKQYHAMFFTDGWMDEGHNMIDEYNSVVERYDEETAEEVFDMMYEHYETMTYLDTGLYDVDALMDRMRFLGEMCDMQQLREPATLSYVERLVLGPWDEDLFVHVPPHGTVPSKPFSTPGSVI